MSDEIMGAKIGLTKKNFLVICQQYNSLGQLLQMFAADPNNETFQRLHQQFQFIGEQLKPLGTSLDALGGAPVLAPLEKKEEKNQGEEKDGSEIDERT